MRKFFLGFVRAISAGGNLVGMVLIGIMVLHVTAEVIARSVFRAPIPATIEIATYYYMIAVAFVPLGYVQWRREHIEAEAIADIVPARLRKFAAFLGLLASIGITIALVYGTTLAAMRQTRFGASVWTTVGQIPIWPSRWMLPLGFGALAVVMVYQLVFSRGDDTAEAGSADKIDEV